MAEFHCACAVKPLVNVLRLVTGTWLCHSSLLVLGHVVALA